MSVIEDARLFVNILRKTENSEIKTSVASIKTDLRKIGEGLLFLSITPYYFALFLSLFQIQTIESNIYLFSYTIVASMVLIGLSFQNLLKSNKPLTFKQYRNSDAGVLNTAVIVLLLYWEPSIIVVHQIHWVMVFFAITMEVHALGDHFDSSSLLQD